jgi:hypothetical protein
MRLALWLASTAVGVGAGCREELGPVAFPTTRVRGVILEGGRPVAGGWITFIPAEGTVGNFRTAPIETDGRFEVTGVAVGRNAIGLAQAPTRHPFRRPDGGRIFDPLYTPIRRKIPPGAEVTLPPIDLLEEAYRREKIRNSEVPEPSR